jgi:hypothetical protein
MKGLPPIICFLFLSQLLFSQKEFYEARFSYEIERDLADGVIKVNSPQFLYSLIGEYHLAQLYQIKASYLGIDTLDFGELNVESALLRIVDEAKKYRVVIISENHGMPQHRIFASRIISELRKLGFGHLGLETFLNVDNRNDLLDHSISLRGYPFNSPITGTYTLEPQMGKLVRNAIQLGYKLFAYEKSANDGKKDREEIQADNILKYLNSHPYSKIIIYCGFHHAIESNAIKFDSTFYMAKYLKDKSGIDPLTIYQDNFSEKFILDEHPYMNKINITEPSTFIDKNGEIARISEHFDIEIIHPKTRYIEGRPSWLFQNKISKAVKVKWEDLKIIFPILVAAYPVNEINSVPVDRIELKHQYDEKVLVLDPGEYKIIVTDREKNVEYIERVEKK